MPVDTVLLRQQSGARHCGGALTTRSSADHVWLQEAVVVAGE
jgi:hypothetical protein